MVRARTLFLLVFVVAAAPAHAALTFGEPMWNPSNRLEADRNGSTLSVPVSFACEASEASTRPLKLSLEVPLDANQVGIQSSGAAEFTIPATACSGPLSQSWSETLEFNVQATGDAPAEVPIRLMVKGSVGSGDLSKAYISTVLTNATVLFRGAIRLSIDQAIGQAEPGQAITYNVTVRNESNAAAKVLFARANDFALPDGWSVIVPGPVDLAAPGETGSSRTVRFTVLAPNRGGWHNEETTLALDAVAASLVEPERVSPTYKAVMLARVRGFPEDDGKSSPAVGPLLALALLGAALAARRFAPAPAPEGI